MPLVWCIIFGNVIMIFFNLFGMAVSMRPPSNKFYFIAWPAVIFSLAIFTNLKTLVEILT